MSPVSPPPRSYLYVPGDRPDRIARALASDADAVVLDLEDAVAPGQKEAARAEAARVLRSRSAKPLFVRINAVSSGFADADVDAVAGPWLTGLRLPKTEAPEEVRHVAERLARHGCKAVIQCLIESALGVERAFDLARAHARVAGIGLGEADLAADLGVRAEAGLAYARSRIVVAARAAGLPPPVQSVYTNVRDLDGLRRSSEAGRDLGFFGRSAVHPAQVPVINGVYTPSEAEMAEARTLVAQLEAAAETATGAFVLADGRFVDRAVVESARHTLALGSYAIADGDSGRPPRAQGDSGEDVL